MADIGTIPPGKRGPRLKGREVGFLHGRKVFAPNCVYVPESGFGSGGSATGSALGSCSAHVTPAHEQWAARPSRRVGYRNPLEEYAYASECCEYPCVPFDSGSGTADLMGPGECVDPVFEEKAKWAPFGISKYLNGRVVATHNCPSLHCSEFGAIYDGSKWRFRFGSGFVLDMTVTGSPGSPSSSKVSLTAIDSTCPDASITGAVNVLSFFPFRATVQMGGPQCCGCPGITVSFTVEITGFCERRHAARLVAVDSGGRKVFAKSECCPPAACPALKCCTDNQCPLTVCFYGLDGCTCFDGTCAVLGVAGPTHGGIVEWRNLTFATCSPSSHVAGATLVCVGDGDCTGKFRVIIHCEPGCDGDTVSVDVPCDGQALDVEVEVTLVCTLDPVDPPNPQPCCPKGSYGYLVRITRG